MISVYCTHVVSFLRTAQLQIYCRYIIIHKDSTFLHSAINSMFIWSVVCFLFDYGSCNRPILKILIT